MVAPLVGKVAQEQTLIPMLREALRTTLRNAWQSGVRYSIATTPETYAPLNVIASYTVAVLPHAAPTGTQADDLETIARSLLDGETGPDPRDGDIVELTKVKVPGIGLGVRAATKKHATTPCPRGGRPCRRTSRVSPSDKGPRK